MKINYQKSKIIFIATILAINFILLNYYIFYNFKYLFNSDSAIGIILADEMIKQASFFPSEWNYSLELWVDRHLLFVPFVYLFSLNYLSYSLGIFVYALILILAAWGLAKEVCCTTFHRLAFIAIVTSGITYSNAFNLYGDHTYGYFLSISLLQIYLLIKWNERKSSYILSSLLIGLMGFNFFVNPSRAIAIFFIPSILSLIYVNSDNKQFLTKDTLRFLICICISSLIGAYLNKFALEHVYFTAAYGDLNLKKFDVVALPVNFIYSFLTFSGGDISKTIKFNTLDGLYTVLRILTSFIAIFLSFQVTKLILEKGSNNQKIFAFFAWSAYLTILFLLSSTTLTGLRYLNPPTILILLLSLSYPLIYKESQLKWLLQLSVIIIISTGSLSALTKHNEKVITELGNSANQNHEAITKFLIENNLFYGYGTYWNAGVISVLSGGKVLVRQVNLDENHFLPNPIRAHSSNLWYQKDRYQGETFLLINKNEEKYLDVEKLKTMGVRIQNKIYFKDFAIFIFSENIANKLDWNK